MLEGTKELYEESAKLIKDWDGINKNELVRLAIENKNTIKYDSYISSIMLKYWNKINTYYYKCKLCITPEDAHTWLVQAVLYAIDNHPWTDEKSSIYNDKNGPDKVINRVMESKRLTFYQQLNRYNRKINSNLLSLDGLTEDYSDAVTPSYNDHSDIVVRDIVTKLFNSKDYFYAFLADAVAYERFNSVTDVKKITTYLLTLDDIQCEIFANRYDYDFDKVKKASSYITRMRREDIKERVEDMSIDMKRRIYM